MSTRRDVALGLVIAGFRMTDGQSRSSDSVIRISSTTPTSTAQPCSNPRMGKVRSTPSNKRLIFHHANKLSGPFAGLAPIANQLTKVAYLPGGSWPYPSGGYDHSDTGIQAYVNAIWNIYLNIRNNDSQNQILWWDWEEFNSSTRKSVNVPASVNYDPTVDTWHAALYNLRIYPGYSSFQVTQAHAVELRKEAVRFCALVAKGLCAKADADGLTDYEQISYVHPDTPGTGTTWASQFADINKDWFCPYMMGGGTPCYFQGSLAEMNANINDPSHWTSKYAARVAAQRAAFGPDFKILPTIWAKWYLNDGTKVFPNNDPCVPADFMTKLFNDILDAGADGALFFQNSDMVNSTGALADRYSARHKEVADIVAADSRFVGIRYS